MEPSLRLVFPLKLNKLTLEFPVSSVVGLESQYNTHSYCVLLELRNKE